VLSLIWNYNRRTMSRATKSGFAAEAQKKIKDKYNPALATEILEWINQVSGQHVSTDGEMEAFMGTLKDGTVLCNLANALKPGTVPKINQGQMPFKLMENINFFLLFVDKDAGIPKTESFMTTDLWDGQDPNSVLICLSALARRADKFGKPSLGPKEAHGEKKHWTEEQLRAGDGIIGLQAGSNKGATQAGMNIGNTRHIVD